MSRTVPYLRYKPTPMLPGPVQLFCQLSQLSTNRRSTGPNETLFPIWPGPGPGAYKGPPNLSNLIIISEGDVALMRCKNKPCIHWKHAQSVTALIDFSYL